MPTKQQVKEQIRALPHKYIFYTKKEIKYLPEILTDDEKIVALTSGYHGKTTVLLVCTNRRLLFIDKGMFFGLKVKQLNLDRIQSLDSSYIILFGSIRIWDGAAAYEISMIFKDSIDPFVKAVRQAIENYRRVIFEDVTGSQRQTGAQSQNIPTDIGSANHPLPNPSRNKQSTGPISNESAPDMLGQLERLAKLREQGHLSDEEFEEQKKNLLSG